MNDKDKEEIAQDIATLKSTYRGVVEWLVEDTWPAVYEAFLREDEEADLAKLITHRSLLLAGHLITDLGLGDAFGLVSVGTWHLKDLEEMGGWGTDEGVSVPENEILTFVTGGLARDVQELLAPRVVRYLAGPLASKETLAQLMVTKMLSPQGIP